MSYTERRILNEPGNESTELGWGEILMSQNTHKQRKLGQMNNNDNNKNKGHLLVYKQNFGKNMFCCCCKTAFAVRIHYFW